jgi:mitochondrial distribution and morphology protein 34
MTGSRGMLAAKQPLVVPMLLRLSHFKLSSYVVLVVSKQKGITLVFKTDPLQNVDINSTFDSIAVIQKFIQKEIEGQLRQMFREDLPGIIHKLSQQWVNAKVEAPYLTKRAPPPSRRPTFETMSVQELSYRAPHLSSVGLQPYFARQQSLPPSGHRRTASLSGVSVASSSRRSSTSVKSAPPTVPKPSIPSTFPELEDFDPTYGMRPEGVPNKSVFGSFGRLFTPNKGLADLTETEEEAYEEFSVVDWEDTMPDFSPPPSTFGGSDADGGNGIEYESVPAVGGGTITRPRVYHSQSLIQPSSDVSTAPSTVHALKRHGISPKSSEYPLHSSTPGAGPSSGRPGSFIDSDLYFPARGAGFTRSYSVPSAFADYSSINAVPQSLLTRSGSPDSLETQLSETYVHTDSLPSSPLTIAPTKDPIAIQTSQRSRVSSISSSNIDQSFQFHSSSLPTSPPDPDPKIILRPSINNSIHQLSTLSHSNHTLSPYTRSLEHFTVRSVPPRTSIVPGSPAERQPVKARRKRTYRLGGSTSKAKARSAQPNDAEPLPPSSPVPPSEFDASDMDRYFRAHESYDDESSQSPLSIHPIYLRRRYKY